MLRSIKKKIKEASSIGELDATRINEDQKRKLESLSSFRMVEQELNAIWEKLPGILLEVRLKLSEPPPLATPPEIQAATPQEINADKADGAPTRSDEVSCSRLNAAVKIGTTSLDPVPPISVEKWHMIKGGKAVSYVELAATMSDEDVANSFQKFLSEFVHLGGTKPYYQCQLAAILEGSGSHVLYIPYSHLCEYSKNLAMRICRDVKRLRERLNMAAKSFMNLSFPNESAEELTVKLPSRHEMLEHFIATISLVEAMEVYSETKVYGETKLPVKRPTDDVCFMLQEILLYTMRNHMKGLSWNGEFGIGDIEVFNGRIFIIMKPPREINDREELKSAAAKDLLSISDSIMSKFPSNKCCSIPYLAEFDFMLRNLDWYSSFWSNDTMLGNLHDLIGHRPFLKPPAATADLLCGIHNACHSFDEGDGNAEFKRILRGEGGGGGRRGGKRWIEQIW